MTIQQCKYILEIARGGSFNEAAKKLFTAQSALSSSVKLLEGELGIKIFERSKTGVFLTADGAEFVRYAEQIIEQCDFIIQRYSSPTERTKLHVSTQHYDFVADVFSKLINMTEGRYDLSLREITTYEVIKDIETAYGDIGIIAIKDNDFDSMSRYLSQKGIGFTDLLRASPHVFVRRGHPLSEKEAIKHGELNGLPYVSYDQGAHNTSFFTEEMQSDTNQEKRIAISDRATLMNVLLTTDCYTVGTGIMPSALNDGKIVSIPLDCENFYRIGYIMRTDVNPSETAKLFISLLKVFASSLSKNNKNSNFS